MTTVQSVLLFNVKKVGQTQSPHPLPAQNAIIYCRVSSKEQIEGTSLESQETACRHYAHANHLNVIRVFVERGESAKFADRPQLLELLRYTSRRENAVSALLVWKVDRLARNVGDHFSIKAGLLKQNVRVISVTEPIDANPEGKLLETILAGFAQFDNDLRAARTVQGLRHKLREGILPWKPPIGYKSVNPRGSKKTKPDEPDQPRFNLLKRAWNLYATGTYSKSDILRLLKEWGFRTHRGGPLPKQSLDNIFRNPYYAGVLRDSWSGEEYVGQHLPMVTQELYAKVQLVIAGKSRSVVHHARRPEFPLRQFVRCCDCGEGMTGAFSRGRNQRYPYYRCFNRKCSAGRSHPVREVHAEFITFLAGLSVSAEVRQRIRRYVVRAAALQGIDTQLLEKQRIADVEKLKQEQAELIRLRVQQLITNEEFGEQRSRLEARRSTLEVGRAGNPGSSRDWVNGVEKLFQPLMQLSATWQNIPTDFQRRFQQLLLPEGYVLGRIGTAHKGHILSFIDQFRASMPHVVPLEGLNSNQLFDELREFSTCMRPRDVIADFD